MISITAAQAASQFPVRVLDPMGAEVTQVTIDWAARSILANRPDLLVQVRSGDAGRQRAAVQFTDELTADLQENHFTGSVPQMCWTAANRAVRQRHPERTPEDI